MKQVLFALFFAVCAIIPVFGQTPVARHGVLDLTAWNFTTDGSVRLDGDWEFIMSELVSPDSLSQPTNSPRDYVSFPGTWNETSKSQHPGNGFATYHLRLIVKAPQKLALEAPHFYSSFSFWVNSKKIAFNGVVGQTKETSVPQWLPQTVYFEAEKDTLDVVIHASNFHHALGGVRESFIIGERETLMFRRELAIASNAILCGGLLVIALTFVAVYFFRKENSALLFACLCLTWALREGFSNLYIVTAANPQFPWEVAVKIEYCTLYLAMVFGILFLGEIFRGDVNSIFKYFFATCNLIFLLLTIFGEPAFFTQFLPVYLSFAAVLLLYIVYVLIHAIVYERQGVWLILGSIMMGVGVFAYDLIAYEGFTSYNSLITGLGYVTMFILIAFCLAMQYGFIKRSSGRSDILTYDDLYKTQKK